jgi:hypothetical protein
MKGLTNGKSYGRMGFRYKLKNHSKILIERPFITAKRIKFLKQYLRYKKMYPNIKFVYLDETWIYQHGSVRKTWVNDNMPTKEFKIKKSEGRRYTVLHDSSSTGFLDGCSLLLASSNNDRDYHKTMNSTIFKKWVIDQLIPAVTPFQNDYKVVVAPYHSVRTEKPPTRSAKKSVLQNYVFQNGIEFDASRTKKQLWEIIEPTLQNFQIIYEIDVLLAQNDIDVLRLPPYHCQYNPIELAWAHCKSHYNKHIGQDSDIE